MISTGQPIENAMSIFLDGVSQQCLYSATVKRRTLQAGEVIEMLKKKQGERSLRQFAADLGISAPYLSDIYRGNRYPGKSILVQLGLVKKVPPSEPVYETA